MKPRTRTNDLYTLTDLRTRWQIHLSNRELLRLLISRRFPMPCEKRDGRWLWRGSDIIAWFGERLRVSMAVQWTIDRYISAPDDTPPHRPVELVAALRLPEIKEKL
jgi:hypothetical protein